MEARTDIAHSVRAPSLSRTRYLGERAKIGLSGAVALLIGALPHVLHHAGPLAGAALFAGIAGSLLFGLLGLLAAVPFLVRLRRRHGSWRAPALALGLMVVAFSFSALVLGPAISEEDQSTSTSAQQTTPAESSHESHHQ